MSATIEFRGTLLPAMFAIRHCFDPGKGSSENQVRPEQLDGKEAAARGCPWDEWTFSIRRNSPVTRMAERRP